MTKERSRMLYNRAIRERLEVQIKIRKLKDKLVDLPEGQIICSKNGGRYKWYIYKDKKRVYLPKTEFVIASKLMYKKYLLLKLKYLESEAKGIEAYLKVQNCNPLQKEKEFLEHPEYQRLLSPHIVKTREKLEKWMNLPYKKNPYHPEHLIHKSASGNVFRSKSEAMIETFLLQHGLFFHYEEELQLGEATYYPDFKIPHPQTGKNMYWEHVGRVDDPDYLNRFLSKLRDYISNGMIPGVNLILTFETKEHPLSSKTIEEIIEKYFEESE